MWSITLACTGKIRSTPCPKLTFRTVMLSPIPVLLRAMTVPSNACRRSLSPSLIFTCTRMVSPGRNTGRSARLFFCVYFVNNAFCMTISLISYLTLAPGPGSPAVDQVRPQPLGFRPRRLPPEPPDLFVIAVQQHFRRLPAAKLRRPRPVRTIQQPRAVPATLERLERRRAFIAQHPRQQPRHRIDDHRRRQFSAAQYVIPDRYLVIGQMLRHPLIHALIPPADQQQLRFLAEPVGHRLVERPPLRRQQHHPLPRPPLRPNRLYRQKNRLRLHYHAFAAAKWPVIHRAVGVKRPLTQIVDSNIQQAGVPAPLDHSMRERPREKLGEDRQHMESHVGFKPFNPSGRSTAMRFAAGSISTQIDRANGIISPPTSSSPEPPPSCQPVTRPSDSPVFRSTTSQPSRSASKNSPGSSRTRSLSGTRTSAPTNFSASEMLSTPRNFRI